MESTSRERTNSCTEYEETIIEMIKQKATIKERDIIKDKETKCFRKVDRKS